MIRWLKFNALSIAAAALSLHPAAAAVFTTKLQSNTVAAWDKYIDRFEHSGFEARPMLDLRGDGPTLVDLDPTGESAQQEVPGGYIHHWVGAIRIPNARPAAVQSLLEDYDRYSRIYSPEVRFASAERLPDGYDVRLVTEQTEGLVHFAFDIRSHVNIRPAAGYTLVESRSYRVRESNSGHAPYTDLLPEGKDHGIVWRLNSYWRLRQIGDSVYAECQVISLSRKPLPGTRDHVKGRARDSLGATLRNTLNGLR
jgi:hypothetical protein